MKSANFLLLPLVLLVSGCFPTERIFWSPMGDRAIVIIDQRPFLATSDGKLDDHPLIGEKLNETIFTALSWLPDGSGFLAPTTRKIDRWAEVKTRISPDEVAKIEALIPATIPLLEAATSIASDAADLQAVIKALPIQGDRRLLFAMKVAYELNPSQVESIFTKMKHGSQLIATIRETNTPYEVNELHLVRLDARPRDDILFSSALKAFGLPKPSPKYPSFACMEYAEGEEDLKLFVASLDGKQRLDLASTDVQPFFDWLPDGRELAFISSIEDDSKAIQSINTITALQTNGQPMKPKLEPQANGSLVAVEGPDRLGAQTLIATYLMGSRLAVLPDGRILFASHVASFPSIATDNEVSSSLHIIAADRKSITMVPTAPGDLPADLKFFAVSPDGRHVAIVENSTDAVAVVELESGKTQIISPPHPNWHCETVPAWKSSKELTFAGLDEASKQPQWMLWSTDGSTQTLSTNWPQKLSQEWLSEKKPEPAKPE